MANNDEYIILVSSADLKVMTENITVTAGPIQSWPALAWQMKNVRVQFRAVRKWLIFPIFYGNRPFYVFQTPFGGLRGNVRRLSYAHWKARSGLPISVNWTFFARCYGWGAMSDYRLKIGDFAPPGAGWPKISGGRGRPHQPFFFSANWAKCSFVWYINLDRSFYRFVTIHACYRQTDRQNSHRT